jgi:hypothetical protein
MAPEISEFKVDKDGYTEAEKNEFDKLRANQ